MQFHINAGLDPMGEESRLILIGKKGEKLNAPIINSSIQKRQITRWDIRENKEYPFCDLQKQSRILGKNAVGDIRIYLDGVCREEESAAELIRLMVKAIVKGGYSFAKEGLKKNWK